MAIPFPDIDPVALSLGPLQIRWYALAYIAGIMLGWRYALYLADKDPETPPHRTQIDDFLIWAVAGIIAGGRLGYVLFYQPGYYAANPLEIFYLWRGGMSFHGGALGVIVAMLLFSYKHKINRFRLSDIVTAAVPIGLFFGRIANFINGELFGRVTTVGWGVVFPYGGPQPRHPSQLYEAILEGLVTFLVLAVLIHQDKIRHRPGVVSGAFLSLYALSRLFIEQFREPDAHLGFIFAQITMGQILSLPMLLAGVGLMLYGVFKKS